MSAPSDSYRLIERFPGIDDFRRLRAISGLSPKAQAAAERGLPNTLYGVSILHQGRAIGMGRIIGDGGLCFVVVDIAVEPEHQGRGLGKRIMAALDAWLKANTLDTAHVSLIADGEAKHLYAQYGFADVGPASVGMHYLVRR